MLKFLRSDLIQLKAYTPHPGGKISVPIDQLDTNESPYDLPLELKAKLAQIYEQDLKTNRYPDGSHQQLKQAIADYINQPDIKENNISVGNGSDELIRSLLIATCLGEKGSILVANPTFSMYEILAKTLGIPVVKVNRLETDFSIDLTTAQQAIDNNLIRVVFVVNPNSPTANPLNTPELDWLRNLPEDILVVIDEAYHEFSQTSVISELLTHSNWIILRTFSKAFRLASHRVGYAIGSAELILALEKVRLPYNLPGFSLTAALLALQNRQLILPIISEILHERTRLIHILSENKSLQIWPSAGNFLYVRLNNANSQDYEQLIETLKEKGTLIRYTGGGLRITIGTPEENNRMIQRLLESVS